MSNLSNTGVHLAQGMYVSSATQQHPLGTRGYTNDGRAYRYALAGASDLVAGTVLQCPAVVAGALVLAVNTTSDGTNAGGTSFSVTAVSAISTGYYREGYAMVATGAGQGLYYQILNHPVVSTGATGAFTLYPDDTVSVAITTTSKISLVPNKYANVVIGPTSATGVIVGVATYVIKSGQYGWIQTWGPAAVQCDDTTAVGSPLNGVAGTAGRASGFTASTLLSGEDVGFLMSAAVQGQWCPVSLTINP